MNRRNMFICLTALLGASAHVLSPTVAISAERETDCERIIGKAKLALTLMERARDDYHRAVAKNDAEAKARAFREWRAARSDLYAARGDYTLCGDFWKDLGTEEDKLPSIP